LALLAEPDDTRRRLTTVMAETLGASLCVFGHLDPGTRTVRAELPGRGVDDTMLDAFCLQFGRPAESESLDSQPLIARHPDDMPAEVRAAALRIGLRNLLVAPVLLDGHLAGAVFVANKETGFDAEDARLATALGTQAMVALRLVGLYHNLRRSDELFRALSENALSGVYLIQEGLFRYVNPAFARTFGYAPEEITGRLRPEDLLLPEYRPQVEETRRRLLQEGRTHLYFGTRGLTKGGEEIEIEVRVFPVPYRRRVAVMGTLLDVTGERRAQRAADERQTEIETLYQASERLLGAEDVTALAGRVVRAVADIFGHALASVYLLDEDGRGLQLAACSDPALGMPESLRMTGPGLAVLAVKTGEIVSVADVSAHPQFVPAAVPLGSELLIPLKAAERVVGVLGLERREKGPFRSRDVLVLKAFAERAALALEKAWIHERLKERSRQLEQLHELALMMVGEPAQAYAAIARQVSQLLRTPYASVLALQDGLVRSLGIVSQVGDQPGEAFPLALTPCRVVVETKDSAIFGDVGERFPEDLYLVARHIKTYIAVPVLDRRSEVVGIVNAMDRRERSFGAEDLRILSLLARRAAEEMEEEQRQREKEITERMLLQSEKLAALGQVVAGVAHDLNNPLASVLGLAELALRRADLPSPAREALVTIGAEAERARKVVRNLLAFAREHEPERVPTDVNDVVRRTLALRGAEMHLSSLEVVHELDQAMPATLADGHLLQQALLNLVLNAEQAMIAAHGRGRLRVRSSYLPGGGVRRSDPTLHLEIEDDGPGIPGDKLSRIFEPFFTTKPVGRGTGLGLSLTFSIVEQHQGVIWAENLPGAGARFIIELPLVPVSGPAARATQAAPSRGLFAGQRVLLADDEAPLRLIARAVLEEEGCIVEEAAAGQAALDILMAREFDLVVSDVRMPDLGGFEVYRLACAQRPSLAGRFLFVTGDVASGETADHLAATGCAYLEKPYHVDQLVQKASQVLKTARDRR
jgi:two-component system NtrC family sensor kinase